MCVCVHFLTFTTHRVSKSSFYQQSGSHNMKGLFEGEDLVFRFRLRLLLEPALGLGAGSHPGCVPLSLWGPLCL